MISSAGHSRPSIRQLLDRVECLEAELRELRALLARSVRVSASSSAVPDTSKRSRTIRIDPPADVPAILARLSPRERQVLALFVKNRTCKRIAGVLGTKPQTVRNQLSAIRTKLDVTCRDELWQVANELRPWLKHG